MVKCTPEILQIRLDIYALPEPEGTLVYARDTRGTMDRAG